MADDYHYQTVPDKQWTLAGNSTLVYQDTGQNVSVLVVQGDTVELPALEQGHLWKVTGCGS